MSTKDKLEHENAERILSEGWKLFQLKGYRGVSVDELCLKCGLTKPTLYYYFGDKENLFVQVLRRKLQGFHKAIETPGSLPERLQSLAVTILDSFQTEYTNLLHDREHIKNPESFKALREAFFSEMFGPLNALMQTGVDEGILNGENAEMLSLVYLGIVNSFIGKAGELNTDNPALAGKLINYFLNGAKK